MKVTINNFNGGMTSDLYSGQVGEFSIAKGFDTLSYPNRLFPIPSTQTATASTDIGLMIVGNDGNIYGIGTETASSAPDIWKTTGPSATWTELTNTAVAGTQENNLLVHYKENHATQDLLYSYSAGIMSAESGNSTTGTAHTLTHTTMCQGFIHPLNNKMFFGYTTTTASYVGQNASGSWSDTALTLPTRYKPVSLTQYGNYLAIGCTSHSAGLFTGNSVDTSVVILWDMVSTTWQEIIPWGTDALGVLNNLNGVLVGVSMVQGTTKNGFNIKGYVGGQPEIIKEYLINSGTQSNIINVGVNFINKNRLYFSVDLFGDGDEPVLKGLWSIGKTGNRWSLNLETIPTTDGTTVSVLYATCYLDYFHFTHTALGTLTTQYSGATKASHFTTPSIFESVVNTNMPEVDKLGRKSLMSVTCTYLPLPASGQVVASYRVDSDRGAWKEIFTETTNGKVRTRKTRATLANFTDGYNYEFRIESIGFAQITGFSYEYKNLP
jgi:hypothetical protein